MDKAIIFGTYEFLGFHLCVELLEQGIEVSGVHFDVGHPDCFIDEKKLLIGRNGNFHEVNVDDIKIKNGKQKTYIFIDFYSFYIKHAENEILSAIRSIVKDNEVPFVFLFPIQLCNDSLENLGFIQNSTQGKYSLTFYLPTIYGPWQPLEFSLQQSLVNPGESVVISDREWTKDAIYIDDVVKTVFHSLKHKETKRFLLKSVIQHHWQRLVSSRQDFQGGAVIESESTLLDKDIIVMDVGHTKIEDGLENQKMHLSLLMNQRY